MTANTGPSVYFEPGELAARTAVPSLFEMAPEIELAENGAGSAGVPPAPSVQTVLPEEEGSQVREPLEAAVPQSPQLPLGTEEEAPSILDRLDSNQRAAAMVTEGPLLIIAGPGTGKTRTLTHRIAHLIGSGVAAAEECLAVTFTRRAAEELRERLEDLLGTAAHRPPGGRQIERPPRGGQIECIAVHTFHSLGLSILRAEHAEVGLHRGFRIAEEAERIELVRELFGFSASRAARLLTSFSRTRRARAAAQSDNEPTSVVEGIEPLATYEAALWQRDLVDFDDLLVLPAKLFAERADLLDAYRARFRWISIDEYQDVDALQVLLVRLLAPEDANICAIGDPDQSIYRFRGAEVGFFLRFQQDYPSAHVVHLGRNYRSSRVIVDAALSAIAPASLVADRELRAVAETSVEPVVVYEVASERAEAERVAHTIEQLLGGTSYFSVDSGRVATGSGSDLSFDDIAVLYRTDTQAGAVMEALDRAGMPYQKRSHSRLTGRPEVRTLIAALRCKEFDDCATPDLLARLRAEARATGRSRRGPGGRGSRCHR